MALLLWPSLVTAVPVTRQQELDQAARLAGDVGTYQYRTDVLQTTHPTLRLENAGRQPETSRMTVDGAVDRANASMEMTIWAPGTGTDGLELKVLDGKAYGRSETDGEWTEIENPSDVFAPGGDPFGFVAAAENVQVPSAIGDPDVPSYTFDINGLKFARTISTQLEAELRRTGELPYGVTLGVARQYVDMKGSGELWINDDGLPIRQTIHLEFPPKKGAVDWVEADITTNFSNWDTRGVDNQLFWAIPRLVDDPSILTKDPLSLFPNFSSLPPISQDVKQFGFTLGTMLLIAALVGFAITHRLIRLTQLYGAIAIAVTLSLVITPWLQSNRATAFSQHQQNRQTTRDRELSDQQKLGELKDDLSGRSFDPLVNPLADLPTGQSVGPTSQSLKPASQSTLSMTERGPTLKPNVQVPPDDFFTGQDSDGDGLNDEVELLKLGTEAGSIDSDGDGISDRTEVVGFSYSGQTWYLNPLSIDTNGDTLMDVAECPALEDINPDDKSLGTPSGTICRDTDGDGTPDVFDFDNDGDGVPDSVDSSPNFTGSLTSNAQDSMNLILNGYATSKSLYVDFEIRPTDANADHLWYTNNVLDWPDNDREGQITRISDTTLSSLENFSGGKTANGDIILTPMLEVEIPAPEGNSSNPSGALPVLSGFDEGTLPDAELGDWLDIVALSNYGITVSQSEDGKLYAYVPLILVEDTVGDTPVAWAGRMYYNTLNNNWGASHKVRMIWLVTAVIDECDPDCENPDTITTKTSIIQTYYEKFHLTGLSVTEHHGMDTAVIAQTDAGSADYENYLWHLSNGLESAFIGAGLVDGERFDIGDIESRFDNDSTTGSQSPQRWGIPKAKLDVSLFSEPDPTLGWNDLVNNQVQGILSANYGTQANTPVNLLFAREETIKSLSLDDSNAISIVGTTLTADLGSQGRQTFASMNWSPYIYDGLGWVSHDLTDYLGHLDTQMNAVIDIADFLGGDQPADAAVAKQGAVTMAKSYYMAHYKGNSDLVQFEDTPTGTDPVDDAALSLPAGVDAEDLILGDMLELLLTLIEDQSSVTIDNALVANNAASGLTESLASVLEGIGKSENGFADAAVGQTSSASSLVKRAYKYLAKIKGTSPKYCRPSAIMGRFQTWN
jgi:hypothetical protein